MQQGCGDYAQDVEKQGQDKDNGIDNVVEDSQGGGQVVHCEAEYFMTAYDAYLTATTWNNGGGAK